MNLLKEAAGTTRQFIPKVGRSYHCDNYTLCYRPSTGAWTILMDGFPVIDAIDKNFLAILESFEWKTFKENDTIIIEDYAELFDQQWKNMSEVVSCEYLELSVERGEVRKEMDLAEHVLGYFAEL
jgi:hypothetical protein